MISPRVSSPGHPGVRRCRKAAGNSPPWGRWRGAAVLDVGDIRRRTAPGRGDMGGEEDAPFPVRRNGPEQVSSSSRLTGPGRWWAHRRSAAPPDGTGPRQSGTFTRIPRRQLPTLGDDDLAPRSPPGPCRRYACPGRRGYAGPFLVIVDRSSRDTSYRPQAFAVEHVRGRLPSSHLATELPVTPRPPPTFLLAQPPAPPQGGQILRQMTSFHTFHMPPSGYIPYFTRFRRHCNQPKRTEYVCFGCGRRGNEKTPAVESPPPGRYPGQPSWEGMQATLSPGISWKGTTSWKGRLGRSMLRSSTSTPRSAIRWVSWRTVASRGTK